MHSDPLGYDYRVRTTGAAGAPLRPGTAPGCAGATSAAGLRRLSSLRTERGTRATGLCGFRREIGSRPMSRSERSWAMIAGWTSIQATSTAPGRREVRPCLQRRSADSELHLRSLRRRPDRRARHQSVLPDEAQHASETQRRSGLDRNLRGALRAPGRSARSSAFGPAPLRRGAQRPSGIQPRRDHGAATALPLRPPTSTSGPPLSPRQSLSPS